MCYSVGTEKIALNHKFGPKHVLCPQDRRALLIFGYLCCLVHIFQSSGCSLGSIEEHVKRW